MTGVWKGLNLVALPLLPSPRPQAVCFSVSHLLGIQPTSLNTVLGMMEKKGIVRSNPCSEEFRVFSFSEGGVPSIQPRPTPLVQETCLFMLLRKRSMGSAASTSF